MHNRRRKQVPKACQEIMHIPEANDGPDMLSLNTNMYQSGSHMMNIDNRESNDVNMLEDDVPPGDTLESVRRQPPNLDRFVGFASLKTETFDNNFKDLEVLKRKTELLHLSEQYLHSKLYTPKLEALQRLVEPGKCNTRAESKQSDEGSGQESGLPKSSEAAPSDEASISRYQNRGSNAPLPKEDSAETSTYLSSTPKNPRARGRKEEKTPEPASKSGPEDPTAEEQKENFITVVSSSSIVNGCSKKRIAIPRMAYQPLSQEVKSSNKVILKVVGNAKVDSPIFDGSNVIQGWLCALEHHMDKIVNSMELCGTTIVNQAQISTQLDSIKPEWMPQELFYLMCLKPIGMDANEYLELIEEKDLEECNKLLQNFNLVNTNAMGYVLDAENDTCKELMKLNRVNKRLLSEEDIYTRILSKMTDNFNSQVEELLQTTRQDLRLAAGDTYLQYGRIKNVVNWNKGDPVIREKGFSHDKASKDKMKTLQRMQEVFGEGSHMTLDASVDEAKYIYYMKLLQDMEESERDELLQQLVRDRTQALAEYSLVEPPYKPENCLVWKTIGVSSKSIIWKMYNTVDCVPVVYKMRLIEKVDPKGLETLKTAYGSATKKIQEMGITLSESRQIKFANFSEVKEDCVIERMELIRDIPVSELIEKTNQMTQAERVSQAQVIVREITKLVYQLQGIDFLLPLKSSRLYISSSGVTLSAGIPQSLLTAEAMELLKNHERETIASILWGNTIDWYLPPEAHGDMAFSRNPVNVSKAHTWMIGKILYEATCHTQTSRLKLDQGKIELLEDEGTREFLDICLNEFTSKRPTIDELMRHPYMKKHNLNYGTFGPMDVGKAQCAVEILGDIETIVLNKINRTEKGVADYEQNENWDAILCESSEEDLCPLENKHSYDFPNYNLQVVSRSDV